MNKTNILYRIWSVRHRLWRGLHRTGFVETLEGAGEYSWEEALDHMVEVNSSSSEVPEEVLVPVLSEEALDVLETEDYTPVVIWSEEHRGVWRDNHCGYSHNLEMAGIYELTEVLGICHDANLRMEDSPEEGFVPLEALPSLQAKHSRKDIWGRV